MYLVTLAFLFNMQYDRTIVAIVTFVLVDLTQLLFLSHFKPGPIQAILCYFYTHVFYVHVHVALVSSLASLSKCAWYSHWLRVCMVP